MSERPEIGCFPVHGAICGAEGWTRLKSKIWVCESGCVILSAEYGDSKVIEIVPNNVRGSMAGQMKDSAARSHGWEGWFGTWLAGDTVHSFPGAVSAGMVPSPLWVAATLSAQESLSGKVADTGTQVPDGLSETGLAKASEAAGGPTSGESFSAPDASALESGEAVAPAEIALPARSEQRNIQQAYAESGSDSGFVEYRELLDRQLSADISGRMPNVLPSAFDSPLEVDGISSFSETAGGLLGAQSSGSLNADSVDGSSAGKKSGDDDLVAAASGEQQEGPVELVASRLTAAQKQAYVDYKFGLMVHYGINTYVSKDGHSEGHLHSPIYTGAQGSSGENPAPNGSTTSRNRTFLSTRFNAPHDTQKEFRRNITDDWARRAKGAGMKFINFISKHHFGWAPWPSAHTTYDIATSSSPNLDLWRSVLDSAKEFGLKVVIYYSIPDRVHHQDLANRFQGSGDIPRFVLNRNDDYFTFAKAQMKELFDYDTDGDMIVGAWFDVADLGGSHWDWDGRLADFADYVHTLDNDVVQIYNQRTQVADIVNFEHNVNPGDLPATYADPSEYVLSLYRLRTDQPREEAWFSYGNNSRRLFDSSLDADYKLASEVARYNDLNILYALNIPIQPNGFFGSRANTYLETAGKMLNGGGRIDDFDLGWVYSGRTSGTSQWTRLNNDSGAGNDRPWQKTLHSSNTTGAYAEYKFFGKSVKLYVRADSTAGDINIYIDGVFQHKFKSLLNPGSPGSLLAYSSNSLSYGDHVIRVEVGEEDEGNGNGFVNIDFLEVAPRIERIGFVSTSGADDTYVAGDTVQIEVFFQRRS